MFYDQLKQACKDNNTSITAVLKKIGIGLSLIHISRNAQILKRPTILISPPLNVKFIIFQLIQLKRRRIL